MLGVDLADRFEDTFGGPRAAEPLHEPGMVHQPRESREELDVFRLSSGRRQQDEENPTRLTLRRSKPDRVRRDGHEQNRGIHTAYRGVRNGHATPDHGRVEAFTIHECLDDLRAIFDHVLLSQVLGESANGALCIVCVQAREDELGPDVVC